MRYLKFIAKSKGLYELPHRLILILMRFGFTDKKLRNFILHIDTLLKPYPVCPTIFITAELLERRPHILSWFQKVNWETGIHGYFHINYSALNSQEQLDHIKKAKHLLSNGTQKTIGFRAPYLSWNSNTTSALKSNDIGWSSHQPVIWDCLRLTDFKERDTDNYQRALNALYKPKPSAEFPVIPYFNNSLLEIPVSLPDDEILIDRLRISDPDQLFDIWNNILVQTHKRGDLFTLLLHPERAEIYSSAIQRLLEQVISKQQEIWMASLGEIADWWKERAAFQIRVNKINANQYQIDAVCTDRATLVLTKTGSPSHLCRTTGGKEFNIVKERNFVLETKVKPIIGISSITPPRIKAFLRNEGFFFEVVQSEEHYAFYIEKGEEITESQYPDLLEKIEKSQSPLVRVWRWPNAYSSAFSLTFDLDAVTLQDFVSRAFDFQTTKGILKLVDIDKKSDIRPTACMLGYFNYKSDARVQNYVNFLLSSGFDVDIICLGKSRDYDLHHQKSGVSVFPIQKRTEKETSRVSYIFNLLSFFFLAMLKVSTLFFRKKYQFIHIHNIPDFLVFTAWLPKLFGAKLILDIHDIFPELYARKFGARVEGLVFKVLLLIEKISCRFADHNIIANDVWKDTVKNRVPLVDKCTTIPNYPDRNIFSHSGDFPKPSSSENKPFTIVYHGSLTEHHGVDIAIKAMGILRDQGKIGSFRFLLYGVGQSKPQIIALIELLKLEKFVSVMGGVPFRDIPKILKETDLGVVPKKDGLFVGDALSTKLFEYAAMGVPAVVSRTPAEQRYFSEEEVRFFKAEDPEDMARCILELYEDSASRIAMAKKALKKMECYNIEVNASKYLDIIKKL